MKKLLIFPALLMAFSLLLSVPAYAASGDVTVYVTDSGEKYHADGCRYLSKSQHARTLADAVSAGYTPCSVCHPPVLDEASYSSDSSLSQEKWDALSRLAGGSFDAAEAYARQEEQSSGVPAATRTPPPIKVGEPVGPIRALVTFDGLGEIILSLFASLIGLFFLATICESIGYKTGKRVNTFLIVDIILVLFIISLAYSGRSYVRKVKAFESTVAEELQKAHDDGYSDGYIDALKTR